MVAQPRCIQIGQDFTWQHGYDTPEDLVSAGLKQRYQQAVSRAADAAKRLATDDSHAGNGASALSESEAATRAVYVLPMAFRKRTLFKMDFAEALYIAELRTTPAGHFSYRYVAYAMYEAVARRFPALAKHFRVTDVREPVDLLKR